jgi:cytochrome c oxidase subunit II
MTTESTDDHHGADGLWRWLVGGLIAGGAILGLLIGAYAVGHHRGEDSAAAPAAPQTTVPQTTTAAPTTTASAAAGPVPVTAALVARGKTLYSADGCIACHSLDGSAGAGPTLKGAGGRSVELADGTTVTAEDAYLQKSITDPDADIVKGYSAGIMSAATSGFDLTSKPDDVRALVAFLKSQK